VYATFDNHMYGDMTTYSAVSRDMGKTWTKFSSDVFKGYAHKIKEDIVSKDLLFLGTEMGLYVSMDAGANWVQMKARVPEYALVRDIVIEPKTNDLVIGTHGRGILIVDDISPLRKVNQQLLNSDVAVIPTKPTPVCNPHYGGSFATAGEFVGNNASEDAQILYYLKSRVNNGTVQVEIFDDKGNLIVDLPGTKRKGINRITWNMRTKPPRVAEGGSKADWSSTVGPFARDGKYKVRVTVNGKSAEGDLELLPDNKTSITKEQREANHAAVQRTFKMQEELAVLMDSLLNEQKLIAADTATALVIREYYDSLEAIRATLVPVKTGRTVLFADEERLRDKLSDVYYGLSFYEGEPTSSQNDRLNRTQREIIANKTKLEDRKRTYRPKISEELKARKKNDPY
jgi:hypothetical protein